MYVYTLFRVAKKVMTEALELHDSDINSVEVTKNTVRIEFSKAYIWSGEKGWGQKVLLIIEDAQLIETPLEFPVTISDGMLSCTKEQFENILPLPFSEHGICVIDFSFINGERLEISGQNPRL